MTRTLTTTIATLAALAWLPPSTGAAAAQETTAQEALEELRRAEFAAEVPAERILRQLDRWGESPYPRTSAELDALADQVAAIAADSTLPDDVRWHARLALVGAASADREGTPYPRAFDLLVRVYEGGYDHALGDIWRADSVRGPAYVRELFERSERPPVCDPAMERGTAPECVDGPFTFRDTPWCRAGDLMYEDVVDAAEARRGPVVDFGEVVPEGMPEHIEDWYRRCVYSGIVF